jgi:hypothetical protein
MVDSKISIYIEFGIGIPSLNDEKHISWKFFLRYAKTELSATRGGLFPCIRANYENEVKNSFFIQIGDFECQVCLTVVIF